MSSKLKIDEILVKPRLMAFCYDIERILIQSKIDYAYDEQQDFFIILTPMRNSNNMKEKLKRKLGSIPYKIS